MNIESSQAGQLADLRLAAQQAAKRFGHDLERFWGLPLKDALLIVAGCRKCGRSAFVCYSSDRPGLGGTAVAERCRWA